MIEAISNPAVVALLVCTILGMTALGFLTAAVAHSVVQRIKLKIAMKKAQTVESEPSSGGE